jgi:2-oxoglutarate dehydrogenase E2 component (dihydrolipoamide succinyltransferase)
LGRIDTPVDTVELVVPALGPAAEHAVVVTWMKSLGDRVEVDEAICRLAVGDLEFEVCSTADGELTRIVADRGTRVRERSALAEVGVVAISPAAIPPDAAASEPPVPGEDVGEDGDPSADPPPPKVELDIKPEPIDPEFAPAGPVVEPPPGRFPSQPVEPGAAPAEPELPAGSAPGPVPSGDDVDWSRWISPAVRMVAEERGIDLSHVRGTGIGGRIRKRDVLRHPRPDTGARNA